MRKQIDAHRVEEVKHIIGDAAELLGTYKYDKIAAEKSASRSRETLVKTLDEKDNLSADNAMLKRDLLQAKNVIESLRSGVDPSERDHDRDDGPEL